MSDVRKNAADQVPASIGRYQITGNLGYGAMGAVYKAFDPADQAPARDQDRQARHPALEPAVPRLHRPLPARGPDLGHAQPPGHRHALRPGRGERRSVLRDGVRRRAHDRRGDRRGHALQAREGDRPREPDRGGARLRALARRRPPRHQARQPDPVRRRQGQGHRLRHREAAGRGHHARGRAARDALLHVARAGDGREARRPQRHLLARRRGLRDAVGRSSLSPARTSRRSSTSWCTPTRSSRRASSCWASCRRSGARCSGRCWPRSPRAATRPRAPSFRTSSTASARGSRASATRRPSTLQVMDDALGVERGARGRRDGVIPRLPAPVAPARSAALAGAAPRPPQDDVRARAGRTPPRRRARAGHDHDAGAASPPISATEPLPPPTPDRCRRQPTRRPPRRRRSRRAADATAAASSRRSVRAARPARPGIPMPLVLGGAAALLVLVALGAGRSPARCGPTAPRDAARRAGASASGCRRDGACCRAAPPGARAVRPGEGATPSSSRGRRRYDVRVEPRARATRASLAPPASQVRAAAARGPDRNGRRRSRPPRAPQSSWTASPAGQTPLAGSSSQPGKRLIEVALAGHETWTSTLDVVAGESGRVDVKLRPRARAAAHARARGHRARLPERREPGGHAGAQALGRRRRPTRPAARRGCARGSASR